MIATTSPRFASPEDRARRACNTAVPGDRFQAASWMLKQLLRARGGLHTRVTRRIRLAPFTLEEARQLLAARRVKLDSYQLLELYMAFGGVPCYLKEIERGESAAQCIDRVCFAPDGLLRGE